MMCDYGQNIQIEILEQKKPISCYIQDKIASRGNDESAFAIGDLGEIIKRYEIWKECLPRVEPFYAVKCNDVYPVLRLLADLGFSFDCASQNELQKVLSLGVGPSRIIYANTYKQTSYIKYAAKEKVDLMTFDCEDELMKIKEVFPKSRLVLRIRPLSNYKVKVKFGKKYGCSPLKTSHLFEVAKELDLNIIGVSFHVGSGCLEAGAFEDAIQQAKVVFDIGQKKGFKMNLLDIGGGFPGATTDNPESYITIEKIAEVVNRSLEHYFPDTSVRIIAEPGRFFVASAFTIATNIIAKRIYDETEEKPLQENDVSFEDETSTRMYYVNDGIYGSFLSVIADPGYYAPLHFKKSEEKVYNSIIWGPTCDSLDMITKDCTLPELGRGDWIYFEDMGAYTISSATTFNGMPPVKQYFLCERQQWEKIYPS